LLLGSGFVAEPCVEYLCRRPENKLTIGNISFFLFVLGENEEKLAWEKVRMKRADYHKIEGVLFWWRIRD
jgi:hypothetical protein